MRFWVSRPALVTGAHTLTQEALAQRMEADLVAIGADRRRRQQAVFVYQRSEIRTRHFELASRETDERSDWCQATRGAVASLATRTLDALNQTLGDSAVDSELRGVAACDGFITVSSTYSGFPSLSRVLQEQAGISRDAQCYDLAGLGCAGPTQGIALAHTLLAQGVCNRICVLCVDAMGTYGALRRHPEPPHIGQIVAHCLASDAGAAVVLANRRFRGAVASFSDASFVSRLWRDALDQNDLSVCAHNQPYIAVGKDIRTRIVEEVSELLAERGPGHIFMHPGGRALMSALAGAHPALADSIALSSDVMRDHGNVGASSLLWVLGTALERGWSLSPNFTLFALGPGIVSTTVTLSEVAEP